MPIPESLRHYVRGGYDIQKLRIMSGNRVVAQYKHKHGYEDGTKEKDSIDKDGKAILDRLKQAYRRLTDGVAALTAEKVAKEALPTISPKKFTKELVKDRKTEGIVDTYTEFALLESYFRLMMREQQHFRRLEALIEEYPIWVKFMKGTRGVGPAMAAVILSEIDIHKALYPSSLHRYAGLDVVMVWKVEGEDSARGKVFPESMRFRAAYQPPEGLSCERVGDNMLRVTDGAKVVLYRLGTSGGRSKKKEHLVRVAYMDKEGKAAERDGITFNPFLKTKLVGVLGSSFVRQSPEKCVYRALYDDYKHRLENHPAHAEKTKGHRHNMAVRYIVKQFLCDLYANWRALEKLPVSVPYAEAKLGIKHREAV